MMVGMYPLAVGNPLFEPVLPNETLEVVVGIVGVDVVAVVVNIVLL